MAKYLLLVMSNPTPGQEAEYNRWYNDVHVPEVLAVNGFTGATRYKVADRLMGEGPAGAYAALYEMESDNPIATYGQLSQAVDAGRMNMSEALDGGSISVTILTPLSA